MLIPHGAGFTSYGPRRVLPKLDTHMLCPLPPGWYLYHDQLGQVYRANHTTGEPRWAHPLRDDMPMVIVFYLVEAVTEA